MDDDAASVRAIPPLRAAYRLQFNAGFGFADARDVVAYLARLGVSHMYASPLLASRAGSTHGYDATDPARLDPELGGEDDCRALDDVLAGHGLGLLLDIVPNHMAASHQNLYWRDVLTHGRASRWAHWFDVDWYAPDEQLRGRVMIPVLGARLPEVLARGEVGLCWEDGAPTVCYHEHRFPVDPQTVPWVLGLHLPEDAGGGLAWLDELLERMRRIPSRTARAPALVERRRVQSEELGATLADLVERDAEVRAHVERALAEFPAGEAGPARMRRFLDRQPYSLAFWRRAADEINYRRFFNIDELVALRMQAPAVLEETHDFILRLVAGGFVDGLRVDHVDGLRDPLDYLRRLRALVDSRRPPEPGGRHVTVHVEKILTGGERLRDEWPVDGTTGYETLNDLESVLADAGGVRRIERRYAEMLRLDRRGVDFGRVAADGKRKVLRGSLASDVRRLVKLLAPIARRDPRAASLSRDRLTTAVVEVVTGLPVYRTYVDTARRDAPGGRRAAAGDAEQVDVAIARAREWGEADPGALDLLREVLLLEGVDELPEEESRDRRRFTSRFQQVSGPAAAKGVEDTALYLYVPFIPLNEVGGEPDRELEDAVEAFHAGNAERARRWPLALVTTSTHDTKRGADTRARIEVLAEMPGDWWSMVARWRRLNAALRRRQGRRWAPDPNTEYLLYQTLVGIWPVEGGPATAEVPHADALESVRARVSAYMEKAVREGKSRSDWARPDAAFEEALAAFVAALLDPARSGAFLGELSALAGRVAAPGYWNGLSRTLLHLTVPGVPDIYQGTELWDFSLVDPDNRRPVDFALRSALLDDVAGRYDGGSPADRALLLAELLASPADGRVKLWFVHRLLRARRERPALFHEGGYLPLRAEGEHARHLVAFARTTPDGEGGALVLAPRLPLALADGTAPVGEGIWGGTVLPLPDGLAAREWHCALTGLTHRARDGTLRVGAVLAQLPGALLV
ncbi:MAG TPA: malto-oligosyltrehalose synthase [Gemmatimonadales bacterium]